ncbi:MAG: translation initiation factor IF-2, partial [Bacteroidia bacterium]|nr:translation initiation factor IF-2 [Bacteroidia bacterium]
MAETIRLNKVLRELNISIDRAVDFLESKGIEIEKRPTTKISSEVYEILSDEFQTDASKKVASKEVSQAKMKEKEALRLEREKEFEVKQKVVEEPKESEVVKAKTTLSGLKQVGKIELKKPAKPKEEKPVAKVKKEPKKKEEKKEEKKVEVKKV